MIDLSDDDVNAVEIMLRYLYTFEIFCRRNTATALQLLIIGDKYDLDEIRNLGMKIISDKVRDLPSKNALWAINWYPPICALPQTVGQPLKTQMINLIARLAGELIKHEAMKKLISTDKECAVLLVETMATQIPVFGHRGYQTMNLENEKTI